jgi:tRNA pseudouridine38-40 synthase
MRRYFIEVAYKGTAYSGFQVQENANTIQAEVEKGLSTLHRVPVGLTGSSRTDSGVHALQNYFHFDLAVDLHEQSVYKLNAILPRDIVVKRILPVGLEAHSRFDALSREYIYRVHRSKSPFLNGLSFYYPYKLDRGIMDEAAVMVKEHSYFYAFSKTNTQVQNFNCTIEVSHWYEEGEGLVYTIKGNRFLRGMVRLLTASMLKTGRGKLSLKDFEELFEGKRKCGFSVPANGLYLKAVNYPENYFP